MKTYVCEEGQTLTIVDNKETIPTETPLPPKLCAEDGPSPVE